MKRFGCTAFNTANTSDATTFAPSTCSACTHTVLSMDTAVLAVSVFVLLVLCRISVVFVLLPVVEVMLKKKLHKESA